MKQKCFLVRVKYLYMLLKGNPNLRRNFRPVFKTFNLIEKKRLPKNNKLLQLYEQHLYKSVPTN